MNCRRANRLLSAYLDGELPGIEHRHVQAHVRSCAECAHEYDRLLHVKRLLGAMRTREPRSDLAACIIQRTSRESAGLTAAGGSISRVTGWLRATHVQNVLAVGGGAALAVLMLSVRLPIVSPASGALQFGPQDLSAESPLAGTASPPVAAPFVTPFPPRSYPWAQQVTTTQPEAPYEQVELLRRQFQSRLSPFPTRLYKGPFGIQP